MGCLPLKQQNTQYSIFHKKSDVSNFYNVDTLPYSHVYFDTSINKSNAITYNTQLRLIIGIVGLKLNHCRIKISMKRNKLFVDETELSKSLISNNLSSENSIKSVSKDDYYLKVKLFTFKNNLLLPLNILVNEEISIIIEIHNIDNIISHSEIKINTYLLIKSIESNESLLISNDFIELEINHSINPSNDCIFKLYVTVPLFSDQDLNYYFFIYNHNSKPIYKSEQSGLKREFNEVKLTQKRLCKNSTKDQFMLEFYSFSTEHNLLGFTILDIEEIKDKQNSISKLKLSSYEDYYSKYNTSLSNYLFSVIDYDSSCSIGKFKIEIKEERYPSLIEVMNHKKIKLDLFLNLINHKVKQDSPDQIYIKKKYHSKNPSLQLTKGGHFKTPSAFTVKTSKQEIEQNELNGLNIKSLLTSSKITNNKYNSTTQCTTDMDNDNLKYLYLNTFNLLLKLKENNKYCSLHLCSNKIDNNIELTDEDEVKNYLMQNSNVNCSNAIEYISHLIKYISKKYQEDLLSNINKYYSIITITNSNEYLYLKLLFGTDELKNKIIDAAYLPMSLIFLINNQTDIKIKQDEESNNYSNSYQSIPRDFIHSKDVTIDNNNDLKDEIKKSLSVISSHIENYYYFIREITTP